MNIEKNNLGMEIGTLVFVKTIYFEIDSCNQTQSYNEQKIINNNNVKVTSPADSFYIMGIFLNSHTLSNINVDKKSFVYGFITLQDYYHNKKTATIQKESPEDETQYFFASEKCKVLGNLGKPFNGIIVDKFIPEICSVKGEKIKPEKGDMFILYKVLFGVDNLLWISENDLVPINTKKS